jgi:hypothetical protein
VPTYLMALFGKYLCYAILALSIDLIWGYCGILSLGHGAFFALGGYAMGMYLMRQIGSRGVYGNPVLPDFMVFLNWKELPWYWHGFDMFWFAAMMVLLVPGLLAFVFGWLAFRSRVTGVYLSIITQAMTYALMLAFFRNDMGFGGNNGLTDFKDILGFNVQRRGHAAGLFVLTLSGLAGGFLICRGHRHLETRQGADRDPRCRKPHALPRLPRRALQAVRLRRSRPAWRASPARSMCRRSASSTPANSRPAIRSRRDLGRGRRARHAGRRGARRGRRQLRQDLSSPAPARDWLFALGALFIWSRCSCPRASSAPWAWMGGNPRLRNMQGASPRPPPCEAPEPLGGVRP